MDRVDTLFVAAGPENADTVAIFVQGGPFPELRPDLVGDLPGMTDRRRISVHQPWTRDPGLLSLTAGVNHDMATQLNMEAMEMLDRVVLNFLERDVTVCVIGHSYGALLTLLWVASYDRPVDTWILAGRLTLPDVVWQGFRDGRLFWFPDGRNPQPVGGEAPEERIVPMRLQADIGSRPFAELLRDHDLSRMTIVYGDQDRLVGALSISEVEFLTDRGARVVPLVGGGHRAMFDAERENALGQVLSCRP